MNINESEIDHLLAIQLLPDWWIVECPSNFSSNEKWIEIANYFKKFPDTETYKKLENFKTGMFYGMQIQRYKGNTKIYLTQVSFEFSNEPELVQLSLDEAYELIQKQ